MEEAIEPQGRSAWEMIHGVNHIPKTYIPPFMQDEYEKMKEVQASLPQEGDQIEFEENANEESFIKIEPRGYKGQSQPKIDVSNQHEQVQNLENAVAEHR